MTLLICKCGDCAHWEIIHQENGDAVIKCVTCSVEYKVSRIFCNSSTSIGDCGAGGRAFAQGTYATILTISESNFAEQASMSMKTVLRINAKCSDLCYVTLIRDGELLKEHDGYVPEIVQGGPVIILTSRLTSPLGLF